MAWSGRWRLRVRRRRRHRAIDRVGVATVRQLAERVGLADVRLHDIRHAFATRLLEHGVQPKVVSEALGHASIGITLDTYSHVMPTMSKVAADALEEVFGK